MATAAAVASARELGETIPDGVADPVGRDRSARPLIDLLLMDQYGLKQQAAGTRFRVLGFRVKGFRRERAECDGAKHGGGGRGDDARRGRGRTLSGDLRGEV